MNWFTKRHTAGHSRTQLKIRFTEECLSRRLRDTGLIDWFAPFFRLIWFDLLRLDLIRVVEPRFDVYFVPSGLDGYHWFYCVPLCALPTRSYSTEYTIMLTLFMHIPASYILARTMWHECQLHNYPAKKSRFGSRPLITYTPGCMMIYMRCRPDTGVETTSMWYVRT